MKLIAIDTASTACSAAVADENLNILACFEAATGKKHSQDFMPGVEQMLKNADLKLADMDAIAVTVGPGSFTGIRIGLATAKAWGYALGKPVLPIITLDALGYGVEGICCPMLDARKNEVYTALYADGIRQVEPCAMAPALLIEQLKGIAMPIKFNGDAVTVYDTLLREKLGSDYQPIEMPQRLFMARQAACLGVEAYLRGESMTAAQIDAYYLRLSEAEQKRMEKNA